MLKILEINHNSKEEDKILFQDNSFFNVNFDLNKRKKILSISFLTLWNNCSIESSKTISLTEKKDEILSQVNSFIYENVHHWFKKTYFNSNWEKQNYIFIPKEFVKEIQIDEEKYETILLNILENFNLVNVSNEEVVWKKYLIIEKFEIDFFEDAIKTIDVETCELNGLGEFNKENFSVRPRWIFLHTKEWIKYIYNPFCGFVK